SWKVENPAEYTMAVRPRGPAFCVGTGSICFSILRGERPGSPQLARSRSPGPTVSALLASGFGSPGLTVSARLASGSGSPFHIRLGLPGREVPRLARNLPQCRIGQHVLH